MPITISITESNVLATLRAFLLSILPAGTEVTKGQVNRVPSPVGPNYVVMTPLLRTRLSTNVDSYSNTPPPYINGSKTVLQPTQMTVQLDVHGPNASDNSQTIGALFRDDYACQAFSQSAFSMQPLYAGDPKQMPFITGEDQYEDRWTMDVEIQINPVVSVDQQFAIELGPVGIVDVEITYP